MNRSLLVFIALIMPSVFLGQTLSPEWVNQLGGANTEVTKGVATDYFSNVILLSEFSSTVDVDPSATVRNYSTRGFSDVVVQKFSASGALQWAAQFGGSSNDYATDITVDSQGNIYILGSFTGLVDFDPSGNDATVL